MAYGINSGIDGLTIHFIGENKITGSNYAMILTADTRFTGHRLYMESPNGIKIQIVVFDKSFANECPTSTFQWFCMPVLQNIIGIEYLNTTEVTDMYAVFWGAKSLKVLDLSHFDTSKVWEMKMMFSGCSALKTIYVGDGWTMKNVTSSPSMFTDCTNLVGGQGTAYDSNHKDGGYAHVDGGTANPGYFTYKNATSLKGDVNLDGSVNISDIVAIINQIAGTATYSHADVNNDNSVDIADVVAVINIIAGI